MSIFSRTWVRVAVVVGVFVIALGAVGLISRSTSSTAAPPTVAVTAAKTTLPSVTWYWTMAVSPSDPNTLVLGTSSGVYRSTDGGKTWTEAGLQGINTTSVVGSGSTFFAAGVHSAFAAGPVVTRELGGLKARSAPPGPAVFATSTDNGKTWTTVKPSGLPSVAIQSLAVDPAHSSNLYAITTAGAFYRSTDGAKTFTLVSPELGIPPWALAVTQGTHFVSGDMDNGSHLSTNGKTWQAIPFTDGRGTHMVMEYAVKPGSANTVLMSSEGIEISTDGGKTWKPSLKSTLMYGPIAWAPSSTQVAYAAGFDSTLWRTTDGGKTWTSVS